MVVHMSVCTSLRISHCFYRVFIPSINIDIKELSTNSKTSWYYSLSCLINFITLSTVRLHSWMSLVLFEWDSLCRTFHVRHYLQYRNTKYDSRVRGSIYIYLGGSCGSIDNNVETVYRTDYIKVLSTCLS